MARQPRLDLPGMPQHVVQRGNNRLPCFLDDYDRTYYRQLLREALLANGCDLHAYVLMDNHVHLLVTPPEMGALGRMMQMLSRRYVGQFNTRHARMTDDPAAFPWFSYAGLCGLRDDVLVTLHPTQRVLGADAYRDLLAEVLYAEDLAAIRAYLQQQRAYGRDDFRAMVEAKTQRFAGVRPAHRPAKPHATTG